MHSNARLSFIVQGACMGAIVISHIPAWHSSPGIVRHTRWLRLTQRQSTNSVHYLQPSWLHGRACRNLQGRDVKGTERGWEVRGSVFQRVRLNYFRITLLKRYLNWLSRRITTIARRLLYKRFQPPLPGKNLQSSLLPLGEFFSSARIPYHMHGPYCVCVSTIITCVCMCW